jgi:hypothetical protein
MFAAGRPEDHVEEMEYLLVKAFSEVRRDHLELETRKQINGKAF